MRKLRVLLTGPAHQAAMARAVRWVAEEGHQVWLLGQCRPQSVDPSAYQYIPSIAAKASSLLAPLVGLRVANAWFALLGGLECRLVAWAIRPDLVHAHFLHKEATACTVARLHPLIVSVWGAIGMSPPQPKARWPRRLQDHLYHGIDTFIIEHPDLAPRINALARPDAQVTLLTLGVDTREFRPDLNRERQRWRQELAISDSDFVFLSPRGMATFYRQDEILKAFAAARPRLPAQCKLVLVTLKRGLLRKHRVSQHHLAAYARELGIGDAVRWIPQQLHRDMPGVYALADCVVNFPSVDTFPATLLEAAASERLIVSARLPCYEHTYLDSCAVFTGDASHTSLADALIEVANNDPAQYRELLRRGRVIVQEKFEQATERRQLLDLYQKTASQTLKHSQVRAHS